jgi:hypothetical protein
MITIPVDKTCDLIERAERGDNPVADDSAQQTSAQVEASVLDRVLEPEGPEFYRNMLWPGLRGTMKV